MNTASNQGPRPFSPRELRHGLVFGVILLLFAGLIGYQARVTRAAAQAAAVTDATNLAMVLESQIHSELDAAVRTVRLIANAVDPGAMDPARVGQHEEETNGWLKAHTAGHPIASALRIFDAQGQRLYGNLGREKPISIADRAYFQQLRDDPAAGTLFSRVALGRISGLPSMWVARAIRNPAGRFLGAVVLAIELVDIHGQFSRIRLGDKGVVVLRRMDDGAVVVRYPGPIEVDNRPEPDIPTRLAVLNQGPIGHIEIVSPVDGSQRIYGYRQIGDYPFVVAVGIASQDYLRDWRQDAERLLLVSLLFVAVLATVFIQLIRALRRRDRLEEELHQQNLLLNTVLGNLDAHVFMKDRAGRFLYANQAVADFLGQPISTLLGKLQTEFLPPEAIAHLRELDEAVYRSGQPQSCEERLVDREGKVRYFWTVKVPLLESGQPDRLIGLATDITELHLLREELERRATIDDLTGLANRGHFHTSAAINLARAQRYGEPLSLLILDIDHFKDVNDSHGHQAGDAVLRGVADHCREAIRTSDLIGRMGGEEFAILLPETDQEAACHLAERLRQGLQERRWRCHPLGDQAQDPMGGPPRDLAITVSIGVATLTPAITSLDALYARADQALYAAKAGGRNRVSGVCPWPLALEAGQ